MPQEESDVSLAREAVPEGSLQGAPGMSADEDELYDAAESGDNAKVRQLVSQGPALSLFVAVSGGLSRLHLSLGRFRPIRSVHNRLLKLLLIRLLFLSSVFVELLCSLS